MDLLIDTHPLIWFVDGDRRLSRRARDVVEDPDNRLFVSAVIAWEFADLVARGRLPTMVQFSIVRELMSLHVLELPSLVWERAASLPNVHGDPIDRMLIAHAVCSDMPVLTADRAMRSYPIQVVW